MKVGYRYPLNLPHRIPHILHQDLWMQSHVGPDIISTTGIPMKFTATTWVFLRHGECSFDLNLQPFNAKAPALILIGEGDILTPYSLSPQFDAAIVVMSAEIRDNIALFISETDLAALISSNKVVSVPDEIIYHIEDYLHDTQALLDSNNNRCLKQALTFNAGSLLFNQLYKCYTPFSDSTHIGRITDQFVELAQKHYIKERFLDFYADKMGITSKHLSRTVKKESGLTAVEWIERLVVLEAKVLLKSTNLNIQRIAEMLNFPSQSMFGKYFKKITTLSPKEFRNQ